MKDPQEVPCQSYPPPWLYVLNGTLFKSKSDKIKNVSDIKCDITEVFRKDEDSKMYGKTFTNIDVINGTKMTSDVMTAKCVNGKGEKQQMTYFGGVPIQDVLKRPITFKKTALGIDVILIGLDSVSRSHWIRKLPKTYKYMKDTLKMSIMEGYNIRTDGTTNNLFAIMTGKIFEEVYESRRGYANAKYVDDYPWIWKEFKAQGYVTHWLSLIHI